MFSNTLSVIIGSDAARVLTRINQDSFGSQYRLATATEITEILIRNSTGRENGFVYDRHNIELRHTQYAATDGTAPERHYVASSTFKTRRSGGDPARLSDLVGALVTQVTALKAGMVQGES